MDGNIIIKPEEIKRPTDLINKIVLGDCLETMKRMPDNFVDLILTDPPYGVNYEYDVWEDIEENLKNLLDKVMPEILRVSKRAIITCGHTNIWKYPKPKWVMAWVNSAGTNRNSWGFTCWQPILVYGKDPYLENCLGARQDIIIHNESSEKWIQHSCPKPINFWKKLLLRGSVKETDLIYDPFMGSGTTARACMDLNRKYIGSEISSEYCEIIKKRLAQQLLF
ncbi:MAG: DNA methyltransferase [Patescibacteria group bacterium]|nr:DNA methyltransferase [Patescibacteria group bacterium]